MKSVKYGVEYDEKASRIELLMRIVWMIPTYIVLVILAVIFYFAYLFQVLHILVLGKRNKLLYDLVFKYLAYTTKFTSYLFLLTDEKNPLMPED